MRFSWLRALASAVLAACGGGNAAVRDAGTPDAGGVEIVLRAHVPVTTPAGATISVMGDFQGWDPASPAHRLTDVGGGAHEITLAFAAGTRLELKFTRGSAETVERGPRGEALPNRVIEVLSAGSYDFRVGSWADESPSSITGDVTSFTVPGFLSGRRVWVYLPPGYADGAERLPVRYMLDGQNLFDRLTAFKGEWRVDETLESLIPAGSMAPIIVVGIDHGGTTRISEYTPWPDPGEGGGAGATHITAIIDVLKPYVDLTYRTRTEATATGIAGSSLGGLMALYAVYARPDVFGKAAALSPSIWWADRRIVTFATATAKPAARVWLDMGTEEYATATADLARLRDAMVTQGFVLGTDLTTVEDEGAGHDEASWSRRFPQVMRFLFPPAAP
jgi:pullulanase